MLFDPPIGVRKIPNPGGMFSDYMGTGGGVASWGPGSIARRAVRPAYFNDGIWDETSLLDVHIDRPRVGASLRFAEPSG